MYKKKYNDIKNIKKKYSTALKNIDVNSYKLHEKITNSLNHSLQSNITEATTTKSNNAKIIIPKYQPKVEEKVINKNKNKNSYQVKKCSYTKFLELRNPKNPIPLGNKEKRFKWQNLKDETNVIYPEIYKKPQKKLFKLKKDVIFDTINNKSEFTDITDRPKKRRLKIYISEQDYDMINFMQNTDIDTSRRVIDPLYNKEKEKINRKKYFSRNKICYHKTNGGIKSLFDLTPIHTPIRGKKLFTKKNYHNLSINLFDKNYGKFETPTHTKRHFSENKCHYDNIKSQNLISDMNKSCKYKKSKSINNRYKTDNDLYLNRSIENLSLRNYENKKSNKIEYNKYLINIKINNKQKIK